LRGRIFCWPRTPIGAASGRPSGVFEGGVKQSGRAKYLLQYGYAQKTSDPSRFREIALQVVDKFPTSQSAAQALLHGRRSAEPRAPSATVCAHIS
jgi:hypothetical protein